MHTPLRKTGERWPDQLKVSVSHVPGLLSICIYRPGRGRLLPVVSRASLYLRVYIEIHRACRVGGRGLRRKITRLARLENVWPRIL